MTDTTNHPATERDEVTGTDTTGHAWDGIKELNTPLPRWWLWTFYLTIIWAIGYWIVYPAWPTITGHTAGLFGYSSRAELATELRALDAFRDRQAAQLKTASLDDIRKNPEMQRIALARGKAAFGDNCAGCHGLGGQGGVGYPNLTDDEWIWGGSLAEIETTLIHGARWSQDNRTRVGDMMAFGKTGLLKKQEIEEVVEYVRSIAKLDVEKGANLAAGEELFKTNCVACHGDDGKGKKDVGAPDLTDAIWLYGSSRSVMIETVQNGRAGIMPAWSGRLDPVTIKALTIYVHSLGGGQ
jgi:cytochrome c oxidase cbb3-type subunit III